MLERRQRRLRGVEAQRLARSRPKRAESPLPSGIRSDAESGGSACAGQIGLCTRLRLLAAAGGDMGSQPDEGLVVYNKSRASQCTITTPSPKVLGWLRY